MDASIGRVVHYVDTFGECRDAHVTEVDPNLPLVVGLAVLTPTSARFLPLAEGGVTFDELGVADGTWHWPVEVHGSQ